MRISTFSATCLLSAALIYTTACDRTKRLEAHDTPDVPTVAVAKATVADLSRNLVMTGEFKPFQEVDVMSKVAGYVKKMYVDVGDRVKEGQLLAVLEIPEMGDDLARGTAAIARSNAEVNKAQEEVRRAQTNHEIAHISYTRLQGVMKGQPGLIAQQEVDDAHSRDLASEAQVDAARSSLVAAEQQVNVSLAEQARVKTMFNYTNVTAPFSGVITKRFADTGSMIQAGISSQTQAMPLVRLSQNSLLRLMLPVPESAVPSIRVGSVVDVKIPSLSRTLPGKVARFAERVKMDTRTMDTEVDVPNANLTLVPGMYAEVDLTLNRRNAALSTPLAAVDIDDSRKSEQGLSGTVLVVNTSEHLEKRSVRIGLETSSQAEILSGLREGELVVIGNRAGLQAGQAVKTKEVTMAAAKE